MVIFAKEVIRITEKQKKLLDRLKVNKNQHYHEVLQNILGDYLLLRKEKKK